jgi:hypothetical protein
MAFSPKVHVVSHRPKSKKPKPKKAKKAPQAITESSPKKLKRKRKDSYRQKILNAVVKGGVCVEIGVWRGDFSKMILDTVEPVHLALVDPWQHFGDEKQSEAFAGRTQEDRFEKIYKEVSEKYSAQIKDGQVSIMREMSDTAIAQFDDNTIDFAYIDGDHSYDGVTSDLNNIFPKMKTDGIIAFDDYHRRGWWGDGVLRAIHEFIGQHPSDCRILMVEGAQIAITKLGPMPTLQP